MAFYDGSTLLDTETLDASATASFTTTTLQAGSHSLTAVYSGDGTFASSTGALTQVITQASPTLTVSDSGGTFDGADFEATALVAGIVSGVDDTPDISLEGVSPTLDYQQLDANNNVMADLGTSAPTTAGSYQVIATFPGSTDYSSVSQLAAFTIALATPTLTVSASGGTFNGSPFAATALVNGVVPGVDDTPSSSLEGVTPTLDYEQVDANGNVIAELGVTAPTQAGSYVVTANFAGSTDYGGSMVGTTFTISQATPSLFLTANGGTYNGQPFPATVLVAGVVSGVDNTPASSLEGVTPTLDYQLLDANGNVIADLGSQAPSAVGNYLVTATFAGSTDYASASQSATFSITS